MTEFDDIVKQARTLGETIAAHPRARSFIAAQDAIDGDADAQKLLGDYQRHVHHIQTLESQGKPIEVADKHKLRDLQGAMAGNDALKQLMRTQADYLELMNRVHEAMEGAIAPQESQG